MPGNIVKDNFLTIKTTKTFLLNKGHLCVGFFGCVQSSSFVQLLIFEHHIVEIASSLFPSYKPLCFHFSDRLSQHRGKYYTKRLKMYR